MQRGRTHCPRPSIPKELLGFRSQFFDNSRVDLKTWNVSHSFRQSRGMIRKGRASMRYCQEDDAKNGVGKLFVTLLVFMSRYHELQCYQ